MNIILFKRPIKRACLNAMKFIVSIAEKAKDETVKPAEVIEERKAIKTESFGSSVGIIFSCLGCVVGTGNIWRFPRIAAQNSYEQGKDNSNQRSGLVFLIAWAICLFLWSSPIITIEYSLGRFTRVSPIVSVYKFLGRYMIWIGSWITAVTMIVRFAYKKQK
ncbi:unnamed protein product [Protopolystoma xenopodis]|uniref:Uncharacterized protein n=1 Tax=Protopolystoma xenopodis TaxID=117903 RepID=A0A3S5CH58_9PLAT|nr:unnamed protein product [Protopolystoma xenopodis]